MLQAELLVVSGKHSGTVIPLPGGKFLIGREEDCHLRPNSDLVSRHHCVFTVDEFTVRLRDLGSTNGTQVNGERIRGGIVLNSGDIVSIGKIELRVIVKTPDQDTVSNFVVESGTGLYKKGTDLTESPASLPPVSPGPVESPSVEGSSAEIPVVSQTVYELPTSDAAAQVPAGSPAVPQPFQNPPTGDTQFGGPMGMPMPPQMGYPQMGYPQMMPYGFPGYPQMYGQPMGYPQMPPGYPPMGMPALPETPVEAPAPAAVPSLEVKLPDPSQTGAKAPPPKPAAPPAGGDGKTAEAKSKEEAPRRAEDIIQQYLKRRPTSGDKK